jgi:hypothetical protein
MRADQAPQPGLRWLICILVRPEADKTTLDNLLACACKITVPRVNVAMSDGILHEVSRDDEPARVTHLVLDMTSRQPRTRPGRCSQPCGRIYSSDACCLGVIAAVS